MCFAVVITTAELELQSKFIGAITTLCHYHANEFLYLFVSLRPHDDASFFLFFYFTKTQRKNKSCVCVSLKNVCGRQEFGH